MKKILRGIFSVMLVMCLTIPSFATGTNETGKITITNNKDNTGISMVGHTYSVYKVLDAVYLEANKFNYSVSENFKVFFEAEAKSQRVNVNTPQKLNQFSIKYIKDHEESMSELSEKLRKYVVERKIIAEESKKAEGESVTIENIPLGYYLVLDNGIDSNTTEQKVIAAAALGTTDLDIILKGSKPTIDKEINHDGNWGNVGDHQIGDEVKYRLKATIPSDLTGYTSYIYKITDKLSEGLTFNNNIEIYVGDKTNGGKKLEKNYKVDSPGTKETTFEINLDILNGIKENDFEKEDTLYIYYSATLNENALVAGNSNDNEVELEYSNNPYDEKETGTDKDKVKDYTFKINVLKTGEDEKTGLEGAEFELSRDTGKVYFTLKETEDTDGSIKKQYIVCTQKHNHEKSSKYCTKTIVSPENGKFEIIGLDDNVEYTLSEIKAPSGYNPIKPIKFTITVTYNDDGTINKIKTNVDTITQEGEGIFELGTTIVNTPGHELPETGGIGTKIFKVVGSTLMIASAILLITRYRLS